MTPARNSFQSRVAGLSAHATFHCLGGHDLCVRAVSMFLSTFITVASKAVQDPSLPVPLFFFFSYNNHERTQVWREESVDESGIGQDCAKSPLEYFPCLLFFFFLSSFLCVAGATGYAAKTREQTEGKTIGGLESGAHYTIPTQRYGSGVKMDVLRERNILKY